MNIVDRVPDPPNRRASAPTWHVQCPECSKIYSLTCERKQAEKSPRCASCAASLRAKSRAVTTPATTSIATSGEVRPDKKEVAGRTADPSEGVHRRVQDGVRSASRPSGTETDAESTRPLYATLARARIHAELDVLMLVARRDRWARYGWRKPDSFDRQKVERLMHAYISLDLASSVHEASGREASASADAIALVEGRGPDVPERIEARGGHETQPVALVDDELEGPRVRNDHHIQHDDNLGTSLRRVNRP